jgi:hypothetical protein
MKQASLDRSWSANDTRDARSKAGEDMHGAGEGLPRPRHWCVIARSRDGGQCTAHKRLGRRTRLAMMVRERRSGACAP